MSSKSITNGKISWTTERRRLSELIERDNNPRFINEESGVRLELSINKFGYSQLYEIEPDGTIIDGHQRKEIMSRLSVGDDQLVEVRVSSRPFTDDEWREYLALKHEGATGEWDWLKMQELFEFEELTDFGFDEGELKEHGFEPFTDIPEEFPEYTGGVGSDVKYTECPECGHEFPK
jgi:hypothetical protein